MNNKKEYLKQRFGLLTIEKLFQEKIKAFRKKFDIKITSNYIQTKNEMDTFFNLYKENSPSNLLNFNSTFENNIKKILAHYNLSNIYRHSLLNYIYTNRVTVNTISIEKDVDDSGTTNVLKIYIYPETKFNDIKEMWPEIKKMQDNFTNNERHKPIDDYSFKKKIWELYNGGFSHKDIAGIVSKQCKNKTIGYNEVAPIIKRIKQRIYNI